MNNILLEASLAYLIKTRKKNKMKSSRTIVVPNVFVQLSP